MLTKTWRYLGFVGMLAFAVATSHAAEDPNRDESTKPATRTYVMASPRACLIGPPIWTTHTLWLPSGAVENFARADGALRVPAGTKVVFRLDREMESVWYAHAAGTIGTSLEVQWRPGESNTDCTCSLCKPESNDVTATAAKRPIVKPCPWITIGVDGARDTRRGPSIGHADVGVAVRFRKAGVYSLRGIVHTVVQPQSLTLEKRLLPAEVDQDVVYVKVVVVDKSVPSEDPNDEESADPNTANTQSMPRDLVGDAATALDTETEMVWPDEYLLPEDNLE